MPEAAYACAAAPSARNLVVELAADAQAVLESQRLRYQIFAEEGGAHLRTDDAGVDRDYYDTFCQHLLVRDAETGAVVASTRILTDVHARQTGGFYSADEFDLSALLPLPGRAMEIGRTCVHCAYRSGGAISVLWSGLARFMTIHRFDYLIGCASVSLRDGGAQIDAIMRRLRAESMTHASRRVTPRLPVPQAPASTALKAQLPPLLKAYLRLGAKVGGEPCWDRDFNVADVFILLDLDDLNPRYQRHFLQRGARPAAVPAVTSAGGHC
ncbi:MAG: GNAT family N-acetyltransferase [Thiotrichales bacterium]